MPKIDPNALRAARRNQKSGKLSQGALAEKIGVDQRTIATWERRTLEGGMPAINEKNLQKLARALAVETRYLTGEEAMPVGPERSRHRLSAEISAAAMFSYDVLEHRYGLSKDELIEAAPMLFEALHHIFLQKRREKLDAVKKLAATIEAIVPTPFPGAFSSVGEVPGWGPNGWGVEASLNFEQSEIDRLAPFTESRWSEIHNGCSSNRFADMLFELGVQDGRLAVIVEEGVRRFPDYLVGLEELREITGVSAEEPVSQKAKQAACVVLDRIVKLAEVPNIKDKDSRVDWLASRVHPADPQEEYDWQPFSKHQADCLVPRHYVDRVASFPHGLGEDDNDDTSSDRSVEAK